jgi:hypothetical protein
MTTEIAYSVHSSQPQVKATNSKSKTPVVKKDDISCQKVELSIKKATSRRKFIVTSKKDDISRREVELPIKKMTSLARNWNFASFLAPGP